MLIGPDDDLLAVPMRRIVYFGCGLPTAAFATCVVLALTLHFDESTSTHCGVCLPFLPLVWLLEWERGLVKVGNYLPSISAAIGAYEPEMFIWRILIALHCLPRFAMAFVYRAFYLSSPLRPFAQGDSIVFKAAAAVLTGLHIAENAALLTLSMVASVDNKGCLF